MSPREFGCSHRLAKVVAYLGAPCNPWIVLRPELLPGSREFDGQAVDHAHRASTCHAAHALPTPPSSRVIESDCDLIHFSWERMRGLHSFKRERHEEGAKQGGESEG